MFALALCQLVMVWEMSELCMFSTGRALIALCLVHVARSPACVPTGDLLTLRRVRWRLVSLEGHGLGP